MPIFQPIIEAVWANYAPRVALAPPSPRAQKQLADLPIDLNSGVREEGRHSGGFIEHFHLNAKGQVDDTRYRLVADEEPRPARKRTRTASARSARARAEANQRVQMQRQPVGEQLWGWGVQWDNGGNRERFGGRDF